MYLIFLIFIPLFTILVLISTNRFNQKMLELRALYGGLILQVYFIYLVMAYHQASCFQFSILAHWFNQHMFYLNWGWIVFALDGISLFFIGLSTLLIPICILMSVKAIHFLKKEFLITLFTIITLLIGVFSVLDILGFYILFEIILIPMFLIIGIWGSREEKIKAAFYFFFYTLIGSVLMLISIFKLYALVGTTNYQSLILINIPNTLQYWLFLGFLASLAVKIPMLPVHIWLPQAHVEAPVAGSVLLAGILLKLGGYGLIRFSFPLFPIASEYFTPFIILLSLLALIYGSLTTCRQTDIKRLIAYSSVAHMGLVTLTIFTHSIEGLIASLTMMIAHGLVSSGLFMTSAVIYTRHHSRAIRYFRGLAITMPIFSSLSLFLILSNISFPLTFNFIAEFFSIIAAFNYSPLVGVIACIGALLATVYALYYYNRIYFGTLSAHVQWSRDLNIFEFQSFLPLIILTLILGVYPNMMFSYLIISACTNISL